MQDLHRGIGIGPSQPTLGSILDRKGEEKGGQAGFLGLSPPSTYLFLPHHGEKSSLSPFLVSHVPHMRA